MPTWRLIALVVMPFAAGHYLAYLFRTINALIVGQLRADLSLGAADLGLLTSMYFLVLAAAQLPVGMLLDRYGPRRVQSVLLMIAASGAALFSLSEGFIALVIARALIGLGMAAALMAGIKAIMLWFPKERATLLTGGMIMLGSLGAVTATAPAERLIGWAGWRGLFELLAVLSVGLAALIHFVVPEHSALPVRSVKAASLKTVYADLRFWRLAPLSATCVGSAWALQGLWAAPWFSDVEQLAREDVITRLFVMAVALSIGAALLGMIADRLRARGVRTESLFAVLATLYITAQLALVFRLPGPSSVSWSLVAVVGSATVLSYGIVAEYFPKELAGRANGALNVFHLGWAFVVQYTTGVILQQWPSQHGHFPVVAYQVAFGISIALQVAALGLFMLAGLRMTAFRRFLRTSAAPASSAFVPITGYEAATRIWVDRLGAVRLQAGSWRLAALGSAGLCAMLGCALMVSASRSQVISYIREVDHPSEAHSVDLATASPSDAQIAYFLARFVRNVHSLPTDPVVVRANWLDALNYVTDNGALVLSGHVRDADPFAKIGLRAVVVEVIYVVRASSNSFEVRWQEMTYENGAIAESKQFTAPFEIVRKAARLDEALKNPIGLYIRGLNH